MKEQNNQTPYSSPPINAVIRHAEPRDLQQLADIYNVFIAEGLTTMDTELKSASYYQGWLDQASEREGLWVLVNNDYVLGWGIIKKYSDRPGYSVACETAVYLNPNETGKGYGTYLKKHLIEQCREFNYHHLVAKIFAENQASIKYNTQLGYEVVGTQREVGQINGQWKDIVIMQYIFNENLT